MTTITIPVSTSPGGHPEFDLSSLTVAEVSGLVIDAIVQVSELTGLPMGAVIDSFRRSCPDLNQVGNPDK